VQVIIFDPMYDSYVTMCKRSGGVIKPVPLELPSLALPREQLAAAFTSRTKFILVNTPHNPTGKVRAPPSVMQDSTTPPSK
jgi:aspartate/methionine/tyrosine aminotransferase